MADTKLTHEEQEKMAILNLAIAGKITNAQAAKQLRLSVRQIQRTKTKIHKVGLKGIVHGLKGKPGNHKIEATTKEQVLSLIEHNYSDFRPTFAAEKLEELHGISISEETARRWMIEKNLWRPKKRKQSKYRSWRPRKEYFGELIQFDGSYHLWFENRYADAHGNPIEVCLLATIDDATGEITKAKFTKNEGIHAVFSFWREYIQEVGKPLAIYLDAFSTYKINHKTAVDNKELKTQFQRAMQSLAITLITAHSAEAKGRVERLFGTLQDRLVKEMRLATINTPEEGNHYLKEIFLPKFNNKFAVVPAKDGNVHKVLLRKETKDLNHIFSIHEMRKINFDFTIQFKNNWYQLTEIQPTTIRPKESVLVATWLDESTHIIYKTYELSYVLLPGKPRKRIRQPVILTTHKLNYKPSADHPWKKRILPPRG